MPIAFFRLLKTAALRREIVKCIVGIRRNVRLHLGVVNSERKVLLHDRKYCKEASKEISWGVLVPILETNCNEQEFY
jgi:hypothetical protein